jgi:hypothetical protein
MLHRYWFELLFGRRVAASFFGGAGAGFAARFGAEAAWRTAFRRDPGAILKK